MPTRKPKRSGWGGHRAGAGRDPLSPEKVRRHRVVVMLRDDELVVLKRLAEKNGCPLGTEAYRIVARVLRRGA